MSAILNETTLRDTLEMVGDDLDFIADLISSYAADGVGLIDGLRSGLAAASADDVRRAAHTLKGTSASLGADDLAESCREVESIAREGGLDGLEERIAAIEAAFRPVVTALEAWVHERAP